VLQQLASAIPEWHSQKQGGTEFFSKLQFGPVAAYAQSCSAAAALL